MRDAKQCREQAAYCRHLAEDADERTAANLEMLARAYDDDARLADEAEAAEPKLDPPRERP